MFGIQYVMSSYLPCMTDQVMLLPEDMRRWLPEDDLVYFVGDTIGRLDLTSILRKCGRTERRGRSAYHPEMMTKLIIYGLVTGVYSSRQIEDATRRRIDFRVISGNRHPDHDTICTFRKAHAAELAGLFGQILALCHRAGLIGGIVCIDGTKILANASLRANRTEPQIEAEQARRHEAYLQRGLAEIAKADAVDAEEDAGFGKGVSGKKAPTAVRDRRSRDEFLTQALAELRKGLPQPPPPPGPVSAAAPPAAGRAKSKRKTKSKAAAKEPRVNVTDPDSRIMLDGATKRLTQAYNAQAAVDSKSQIIVACAAVQDANDKRQLVPMVAAAAGNLGAKPRQVAADAGYFSEEQVTSPSLEGIEVLVPPDRECMACEIRDSPDRPGDEPVRCGDFVMYVEPETPSDGMRAKLRTSAGRKAYAARGSTVEPAFGQIKQAAGFRRFLTRGCASVEYEWRLVCLASNIRKLFRAKCADRDKQNRNLRAPARPITAAGAFQLAMEGA